MKSKEVIVSPVAIPDVPYDCDTHYPRSSKEVIKGGRPVIKEGALQVPERSGLGVELHEESVAKLNELHHMTMVTDRDDTDEMPKYVPDYVRKVPR